MKKRSEKLDQLPPGCDNIRYYGLRFNQLVTVRCEQYNGIAWITGTPPQGVGFYVRTATGKKLWLDGKDVVEATIPS